MQAFIASYYWKARLASPRLKNKFLWIQEEVCSQPFATQPALKLSPPVHQIAVADPEKEENAFYFNLTYSVSLKFTF